MNKAWAVLMVFTVYCLALLGQLVSLGGWLVISGSCVRELWTGTPN